jgi:eukaryotic-like serine/threonine-protein kinase
VLHPASFPSGQVLAALPKALLLYLDARGGGAADEWLRACRLRRDDLADETRTMPIITLRSALDAFVTVASRDEIERAWPWLVAPHNLGAWARVIRGASSPEQAFSRLDGSESEYGRSTRWETLEGRPGFWRGRVLISHDPVMEEKGLLALMRAAEVRAVPALFGFRPTRVRAEGVVAHEASVLAQTYEVRWHTVRNPVAAATGLVVGAAAGTIGAWPHLVVGAACAGVGALMGLGLAYNRLRRAEARAQLTRVHILERSLELKEERERTTGQLEGDIIAGLYRIGQRMGSGAAGVIYQAQRVSDGLPVAVKLLRVVAAHESVAADRLRREAEALRLAWHPNIVEILDQGHLPDGTSYLVMELLMGDSLATRIRQRGKLPSSEVIAITLQLCDALVAVHAAGIVHRDLKPSNLILVKAPEGDRVKLIDFGIARVEWEETRITNMGAPLGTPGYMSPEQENGGAIDARSDLFAIGAMAYECLVGEPPPPVPSGLFNREARERPLHSAWEQLPAGWRGIIEKTMAQSPDDRYQDARSLAQAIRTLEAPPRASGAST